MSTTQIIIDRIAQKKQELAALEQVRSLSENTDAHCLELSRQMTSLVNQYNSMLAIAKGWTNAFENATLVDITETAAAEEDSEMLEPECVIRISAEPSSSL